MKTILGIHDGHNAAAALLEQGRVVAAVQEERLTGNKNQGGVPRQAIADVLSTSGVAFSNIARVALNGNYMTYDHWDREPLSKFYEHSGGLAAQLREPLKGTIVDGIYQKSKAQQREQELARIGFDNGRIAPVIHHTAHAAAAYYGSALQNKVLVLTCDGGGDRVSATVNIAENGRMQQIASVPESESLGHLYSMVTYYMGMMPLEHEYKVMGLAPYVGDSKKSREQAKLFADLFEFDSKNPLVWRRRKGVPSMFSAYGFVRKLLYRQRFDLVAAGLQQFVEDMLIQWVRNCVRETGIHRVACGGGVFMNVKANKEILALPEVEELFVFPSCGDETNSVGAAYWVYAQERLRSNQPVDIEPLGPIYWGRGFDDSEVETALKQFKGTNHIHYKHVENIERLTAETLAARRSRCTGQRTNGIRGSSPGQPIDFGKG